MGNVATYLRYMANGFAILVGIFILVPELYELFVASKILPTLLLPLLCPFLGVIFESISRSHIAESDTEMIYHYVSDLINRAVIREKNSYLNLKLSELQTPISGQFYRVLSKSIYEAFIWTFPETGTYMNRVNQQIRLAYFYLNSYRLITIFVLIFLLLFLAKILDQTHSSLPKAFHSVSMMTITWIPQNQASSLTLTCIIVIFSVVAVFVIGRYFKRYSRQLFEIELDSRLVILKKHELVLSDLINKTLSDDQIVDFFVKKAEARSPNSISRKKVKYVKESKSFKF